MLSNEYIICFGFAEWDNPYKTNQHHIMSRLSVRNKVLFIESLGLRQPTIQRKDICRIFRRVGKFLHGPRKVSDTLRVYAPLVLPFHSLAVVRLFNTWFLRLQLEILVRMLGIKNPIIWSYIPNAVYYLGRWHEKLSVYHCVDDLTANPRIPQKPIKEMENRFVQQV